MGLSGAWRDILYPGFFLGGWGEGGHCVALLTLGLLNINIAECRLNSRGKRCPQVNPLETGEETGHMLGVGTQTDEFLHGTLKTLLIPLSVSSVTERESSVVKLRWTKPGFVWPTGRVSPLRARSQMWPVSSWLPARQLTKGSREPSVGHIQYASLP